MADEQIVGSPEREIHVDPLVHLQKVDLSLQEENEEELYKMRAKLYRFHTDEKDGSSWKERGVGDIKIMKHKINGSYRIVMRREKTLKLCANHQLISSMELKPHGTGDKALIWNTPSDFADGDGNAETLCVRFGKPESTIEFKEKFEECVNQLKKSSSDKVSSEKLSKDLSSLSVKDENENMKNNGTNEEAQPKCTGLQDESKVTNGTTTESPDEINTKTNGSTDGGKEAAKD